MPRALPLLGSMPEPAGYPPTFAIWRRSGGPPKSMHSKSNAISKTSADKCHYPSFSRFGP